MIKNTAGTDVLSFRSNDMIACNLLKHFDRYEQLAILCSVDNSSLKNVFEAAMLREDYEICQVIKELMQERD